MSERSLPFGERGLVLLIDPDRATGANAAAAIRHASGNGFKEAWIGGTFLHRANGGDITRAAVEAGRHCSLPVFAILGLSAAETTLVPGLSGVLLPLIGTLSAAGELVGQAYRATPALKALGAPVVPMAYLVVDGGRISSSSHGLQGVPLPRDKPEIAATLALCGELTGADCVYLDAGSGAPERVPADVIAAVRAAVGIPLFVGGITIRKRYRESLDQLLDSTRDQTIRRFLLAFYLYGDAILSVQLFIPIYLREVWSLPSEKVALTVLVALITAGIGAMAAGALALRYGIRWLLVLVLWGWCIGLVGIALAPSFAVFLAFFAPCGLLFGAAWPISRSREKTIAWACISACILSRNVFRPFSAH